MEVGTQIVYEIQVLNQKIIKDYLEARSI